MADPGRRARRDGEDFTDAGVGDEYLGTIEDIMIPAIDGGGRGAAASLPPRVPSARIPEDLSSQERDASPLLVGAEIHDGGGAEWCER
jgi:hypothetical protein